MPRPFCSTESSNQRKLRNVLDFQQKVETHGYSFAERYNGIFNRSLARISSWDPLKNSATQHGAIFNLEFSPNGNMLVSACKNQSILLFDPISYKKIGAIDSAHTDCVNCICFINQRTFATGSDDKTISIWDSRKLNSRLDTLKGHHGWVKSIDYDKTSNQLITSAFDDTVLLWDINKRSSDGAVKGTEAFKLAALVRTKLSCDSTQMFLTTTSGLGIIAIHNLKIDQLHEDCKSIDFQVKSTDKEITRRAVNRVELIRRFSGKRGTGCISSIDVHPYGWCILSRYSDVYGRSEWTTVHDTEDFRHGDCVTEGDHYPSILTHFLEEANLGRGFIKEVCFNLDGRIICSPFGNGVRILAFDKECGELSCCAFKKPRKLTEIKTLISHKNTVLTSKFSPCLPILATGCLDGVVSFHLPKI